MKIQPEVVISLYTTSMGDDLATIKIIYHKMNTNKIIYKLYKLEKKIFINLKKNIIYVNLSTEILNSVEIKEFLHWLNKNLE